MESMARGIDGEEDVRERIQGQESVNQTSHGAVRREGQWLSDCRGVTAGEDAPRAWR